MKKTLSQAMVSGLILLAYKAMGDRAYWRHAPRPTANTRIALLDRGLITAGPDKAINDAGRAALLDAMDSGKYDVPDDSALRAYLATTEEFP